MSTELNCRARTQCVHDEYLVGPGKAIDLVIERPHFRLNRAELAVHDRLDLVLRNICHQGLQMVNKQTARLMRFFPVHVDALCVQRTVDTTRRSYQDIKQAIARDGMTQVLFIDETSADGELSRVYVMPECSIRAQACIDLWREHRDERFAFVPCSFDSAPAPSLPPHVGGRDE